jgi:anti-anti-sigma factor
MSPISVACFKENVWIRISGRGNFQCSGGLKELVLALLQKGHHNYVVDLISCEQMDSTFMGTITGIAQRLRQNAQGTIKVVNVNQTNQDLMENLGLDQLFSIQSVSFKKEVPPTSQEVCFCEPSLLIDREEEKKKTQAVVLAAHQALVEVDQKNAEKFKDLFELIR